MCDTATYSIIRSIVSRRVALGQSNPEAMFTALDISREAQNNFGVTLRHRDMKNDIHAMYDNGEMSGYTRQGIQIDGVPGLPFLYFPYGADISQYKSNFVPAKHSCNSISQSPQGVAGVAGVAGVGTPAPVPAPANVPWSQAYGRIHRHSPDPSSTTVCVYVDNRGRVAVPNDMLKKIGLYPGDTAYVDFDSGSIRVRAGYDVDATNYTVDRSGNVRIGRSTLQQVSCRDMYTCTLLGNEVVIS